MLKIEKKLASGWVSVKFIFLPKTFPEATSNLIWLYVDIPEDKETIVNKYSRTTVGLYVS